MRSLLSTYLKGYVAIQVIHCWWLWYVFSPFAYAADIQASAQISDGEIQVGQAIRLDIIVHGAARNVEVPDDVKIEGLRLSYIGRSMQVRMFNTQVASSSTHTFSVHPLRAGDFVIPAFRVRVDGKIFQTQPLSLKVVDTLPWKGISRQGTSRRPKKSHSTGTELAFGAFSIPKKEAYVGEVIPVEVQYFFHPHFSVQSIISTPSLIGEGFIVQKMEEPSQSYRETNGIRYTVLTFRSSICPIKVGKLQIPPASLICQVLTQSLPDILPHGVTDAFFQRFFGTISAASDMQKIEVKSDSATIQALPLPDKGQPISFHGAVGNFALRVEVSTKDPSPGDPVTLRAIVSGNGNFEQIRELDLDAKQGWKSYSPSSRFRRLGKYSEKVFEWVLVPNVEKKSTPEVVFSYFNPTLMKYITLRSASAVRAKIVPPSTSAPITGSSVSLTEKEKRRIVRKFVAESYQPITERPEFVVTNGIAFLVLLAFIGVRFTRNLKESGKLQHSLKASLDRVSDPDASPEKFYSSAVEFLLLWAQLASGRDMKGEPAQEIVHAIGLVGKESELALKIFALHEELSYGFRRVENPSIEARTAILRFLRHRR